MSQRDIWNKYEFERRIARGGQAEVFLAVEKALNRKVAIKRLNLLVLDEKDRKRFLREARILAKVKHRHVVRIYTLEDTGDDLYVVMEYADHGSLLDQIKSSAEKMSIRYITDVGIAMCEALAAIHKQRVIHRDVKSANILMVTEDGVDQPVPKLADFGTARDLATSTSKYTSEGEFGTFPYMPPATITGRDPQIDEKLDIYGLGAVLYEALTGRPPFGNELEEILNHIGDAPTRPSAIRKDTPEWLETLVLKALAPNRDDRYSNMHEMLDELEKGKKQLVPPVSSPIKPESRLKQFVQRVHRGLALALSRLRPYWRWFAGATVAIFVLCLGLMVGSWVSTRIAALSPSATATASQTASSTHTATYTAMAPGEMSPTYNATPSPTLTFTPTPTPTLAATNTAVPTLAPSLTQTRIPLPTDTPKPERPRPPANTPGPIPTAPIPPPTRTPTK